MTTDTTTEITPTPPPKDEILTMIEVLTLPEATIGKTKTTHHDNKPPTTAAITKVEIHTGDTTHPNTKIERVSILPPNEPASHPK